MIKETDCLHFLYSNQARTGEVKLESKLQFSIQAPIDKALPERAILVKFSAGGADEKLKLECACRVIFSFESPSQVLDGKELLQAHQAEAYRALAELVERTLQAMGQNTFDFPDISCQTSC